MDWSIVKDLSVVLAGIFGAMLGAKFAIRKIIKQLD